MRVIVTGSRHWPSEGLVWSKLDECLRASVVRGDERLIVVHGDAPRGADRMARAWCESVIESAPIEVVEERHPADWKRYGRAAGFRRNDEMAGLSADHVLAFRAGGESRGTDHMIAACRSRGLRGTIVRPLEPAA